MTGRIVIVPKKMCSGIVLELFSGVVFWSCVWSCVLELCSGVGVVFWSCVQELCSGVVFWNCVLELCS